jgi:hypothetical protein
MGQPQRRTVDASWHSGPRTHPNRLHPTATLLPHQAHLGSYPVRIVTIEDGQDLLEALARAVPGLEAWVQASGHVEDAEIRIAGTGADPRRRLTGRWTLVTLSGPASGPFTVLLARAEEGADGGVTLAAGTLLAARSAIVNLAVLEAPAAPESEPSSSKRRALPSTPPPGASWVEIAAATAASVEDEDIGEESSVELPRRGDLVHHFSFGLCEVLSVSGDRLKIRDAHGPGRIRHIFIDALRVIGPSDQNGKRLFKLVRKV